MVTSVAVVGVSASDAGATTASVSSAIEYSGDIELALSEATSSPVSASEVTVKVDGTEQTVDVGPDGTDGRVVLTGLDDVGPHQTLTVQVDSSDLSTDEISVQITGSVLRAGNGGNFFKGADVAYVASDTDVTFDIYREDEYLVRRGTGTNSRLYVIDTDDMEIGPTHSVEETDGAEVTTEFNIRDLGLAASVNRTDVPGGGAVEVSMSSNGAARPMFLRLVDVSSGDSVRETVSRVGGDGEGTATFAGLSEGTYRIEAEDIITGITTDTSQISVGSSEKGEVLFASSLVTEQRGDIVDVPLSFSGPAEGGEATVTLGGSDINFEVTATVTDDDGDGEAMLRWNTAMSQNDVGGLSVEGGSLGAVEIVQGVDGPVVTGEYPLSVSYGGQETDVATAVVEARSTDGLSVLTAPTTVDGWDGPEDIRERTMSGSSVALDILTNEDDWVVVELRASGLGGYVSSAEDLDGANGLTLDIVESDDSVGPNEDPLTVDTSAATLFSEPGSDRYYLAFRPEELVLRAEPGDEFDVEFAVDAGNNPVTGTDETVSTSFQFVNGTASFDTEGGTLEVPPEAGATVTGTSSFALGTELTVVLRSEGGENPFIEDVDGITVGADGSWSATFDLSGLPEGQTFTARVKKAGQTRQAVEGELTGDSASTSTETSSETTETSSETTETSSETTETAVETETTETSVTTETAEPTPTTSPGFGLVVALAAVLAAALRLRRQ